MLRPVLTFAVVSLLTVAALPGIAKGEQCCSESGGCKKAEKGGKTPMAGSMYEITVSQSGGIAGIHKELTIDSSKLKKPQQAKLGELIADTGIMKQESQKKVTAGAADMFFYEFKVTCCGKTHTATFDEGTLPASYKTLREYLNEVQPKK